MSLTVAGACNSYGISSSLIRYTVYGIKALDAGGWRSDLEEAGALLLRVRLGNRNDVGVERVLRELQRAVLGELRPPLRIAHLE